MEAFRLTADFKSPIALGRATSWTLDAICFGILTEWRELGLSDLDPISNIPLLEKSGIFFASSASFQIATESAHVKIGGIRPVCDLADAQDFLKPNRGDKMPKISTSSGAFKAHLSRYRLINSKTAQWIGYGDPDKVCALLKKAGALGAMRKDGFGRLSNVDYEGIDYSENEIIVSPDGKANRPIPTRLTEALGVASTSPIAMLRARPPYWSSPDEACHIPQFTA